MRAFAAVFMREVVERRMAFLVGLCAGLLGLGGSAVIGWSQPGSADIRLMASVIGGGLLTVALALGLGASVLAGETAERRISFYFSRPIPAGALWAGKLSAVLVLAIGPAILAVIPALLAGGGIGHSNLAPSFEVGSAVALYAAVAVGLVLGAHAVATVVRLRSPWIALDALFTGGAAVTLLVAGRALMRAGVLPQDDVPSPGLFRGLLAVLVLAVLVASGAQVAVGRTDARRAHGSFSTTLWGIVWTIVLAPAAYACWCASARATDLASNWLGAEVAPRGAWLVTAGPLRGARGVGAFLFDAATGRSLRIRGYQVTFSLDGSRAAWGEPDFGLFFEKKSNREELMMADLASGHVVATGLEASSGAAMLSPAGGRLLLGAGGGMIAEYDVSNPANPKQVGAFPRPENGRAFAFVDEETLRAFPQVFDAWGRANLAPAALEITELSLPSKKTVVTGRFDRDTVPHLRLSADGRYLLGERRASDDSQSPTTLTLHDGRTGALLATLASDLRSPEVRFLSRSRLAVVGLAGASARALFFEGEKGWGAPARIVELGPAQMAELGGEMAAGRVAISLFPFEERSPTSQRAAKLVIVDARSGAVSFVGDGLVPAKGFGWPVLRPAEAGAPWTCLFLDADSRLVRIDPATGVQTVLLGKGK